MCRDRNVVPRAGSRQGWGRCGAGIPSAGCIRRRAAPPVGRCGGEPASYAKVAVALAGRVDGGVYQFTVWWNSKAAPARPLRDRMRALGKGCRPFGGFRQGRPAPAGSVPRGVLENAGNRGRINDQGDVPHRGLAVNISPTRPVSVLLPPHKCVTRMTVVGRKQSSREIESQAGCRGFLSSGSHGMLGFRPVIARGQ